MPTIYYDQRSETLAQIVLMESRLRGCISFPLEDAYVLVEGAVIRINYPAERLWLQ